TAQPRNRATAQPRNRATAQPRNRATAQPRNRATAQPRNRATHYGAGVFRVNRLADFFSTLTARIPPQFFMQDPRERASADSLVEGYRL
ncbi:MAG: PT domain-containing protein, partial [Treponema sp.]|nr:PT domain-containing protein [Treponema sp.]